MKRFSLLLALPLAACATMGNLTPAQRLFAADGTYASALHAARAYSDQPQADRGVVHALNDANKHAQPAHELVIAYKECVVGKNPTIFSSGVIVPCTTFDFSAANLSGAAAALRDAAIAIQQKVPTK